MLGSNQQHVLGSNLTLSVSCMGTGMQPKEIGLPFTAYYAVDEVREVRHMVLLSKFMITICMVVAMQI